jgi:hypothetical protein
MADRVAQVQALYPRLFLEEKPTTERLLAAEDRYGEVASSLGNIFPGVQSITLHENCLTGWTSTHGEEVVTISEPVALSGPVNEWLATVEAAMQTAVRESVESALQGGGSLDTFSTAWVEAHIA